jgi:uncharacterized protein
MDPVLRPATAADRPRLLELNAESVHFLSPLDAPSLDELLAMAAFCVVTDDPTRDGVDGFLLALKEGAAYDSPNYRWFAARYARFLYVDRIVIAGSARGLGRARLLYGHLFATARALGVEAITAEFDIEPPNEPSRRLHAAFDFEEVGRQRLPAGKWVSLQLAKVNDAPP